jgi:two-component system, cell cycle response regulator
MRVLLAHALTPKRRRIARVLAEAGHDVREVSEPGGALALCREWSPDVALIHVECCGDLVCGIKSDPDAYGTAIVMIERPGLDPAHALEGMRQGIQDFLVEPLADGEVLTRVEAAARTKELREELVAQGARLESLLREDALTGLSNRRAVLTQLAGMVSAARRHGHPLSIAILDLDHFKRINDAHGHKVGDDVLVAAAHAMGTHLRAEDQLGRLGGEEFLVLLPGAGLEATARLAEELRASVTATTMGDGHEVTMSLGVSATRPGTTWTYEPLFAVADAELYRAKAEGRDRVCGAALLEPA